MEIEKNPLYRFKGLPPFGKFDLNTMEAVVHKLIDEAKTAFADLEAAGRPSWDGVVKPLFRTQKDLEKIWGSVISHLSSVDSTPAIRSVEEKLQPELIALEQRMNQSHKIYKLLVQLRDSDQWPKLSSTRQRVVTALIKNADHNGVSLQGSEKARFNEIKAELSQLGMKFRNNGIDSRKLYSLVLEKQDDVAGLPESWKQQAAASYNQKNQTSSAKASSGPWIVDLSMSSLLPFLRYSDQRNLREKLHKEHMHVAAHGEFDNAPILKRILHLRRELAQLLGFRHFGALSLDRKMAAQTDTVMSMYENLKTKVRPAAKVDFDKMQSFAKQHGQSEPLQPWDRSYWMRKMEESLLDIDHEALRSYFPHDHVIAGMFSLVKTLFGVDIKAADGKASVWHSDVRFYEIYEDGNHIASFFLDLFERPGTKRAGAWMASCCDKDINQVPVAYLNANFPPKGHDGQSLLRFSDVKTLFHEFGHGLQHMLTEETEPGATGIEGIEWDAVELPSQFMEYWCYVPEVLQRISKHTESGQSLPQEDINKLKKQQTFLQSLMFERQMHLGITDMTLYTEFQGEVSPFEVFLQVSNDVCVFPVHPDDKMLCTFGHIFDGGYAAGYYSYMWADILSADAFYAFVEAGLDDQKSVQDLGKKFRKTVLALGGGRHPSDVFRSFRERDPNVQALLKHNGFVA